MEEKTNRKARKNWYTLVLFVGVILLIVFILWLLMKGDVKTTGEYPDDTSPQSLECVKKDITYRFFTHDDASNSEIKITALFAKSKIDSISLIHKTTYATKEDAKTMSDGHQGDMNTNFYGSSMPAYALNATYSQDDKTAQMALYAKSSELNDKSIKYFMLDSVPENLTGYKRGYLAQGFACEIKR